MNLSAVLLGESTMRLKGGLYHQTQIRFAYNSNKIEGNRLSENQVGIIFTTSSVPYGEEDFVSVDDITETINHFSCFDYML